MVKFWKDNKRLLCVTFFATIFVHLIKLVNYYPTWDSIPAIVKPWKAMIVYGRWFSGTLANLTSSPYDLQWLEGVSAALFIALSLVLFLKIFSIENKVLQYLSVATFVTFPALTATFAYQNWASAYMCALFFALLAVYLCIKAPFHRVFVILCAAILFTLSLATYQIYFTFALLVVLFYLFTNLLNGQKTVREMRPALINFGVSFLSGAVLYWGINKVVLSVLQSKLSDYQGLSSIRIPTLSDIWTALYGAFHSFSSFFKGDFSFFSGDFSVLSLYQILNGAVFAILAYCVIRYIIINKKIKVLYKILLLAALAVTVPIVYAFTFTSSGVSYHRLMEIGNYFVYFLPILFLQHTSPKAPKFKKLVAICLVLVSLYNFMNANIAYHQMSISYEKTYFQNIELASKIDEVSDEPQKTVAVIGSFREGGQNLVANPAITGATTSVITRNQYHVVRFANYYLGRSYTECDPAVTETIKEKEAFKAMPIFPAAGSVKLIDGVVVVKLSDPYEN